MPLAEPRVFGHPPLDRCELLDRVILGARLYRPEPVALKRLGENLGIARERVRQLAKRISGEIEASAGRLVAGIAAREQQTPIFE